jgi:hypothetical protein
MKITFSTVLTSVGNPDYGQSGPQSNRKAVTASSLDALSRLVRAYILEWDLGGGNWTEPKVLRNGTLVGRISYNGRIWADNGTEVLR